MTATAANTMRLIDAMNGAAAPLGVGPCMRAIVDDVTWHALSREVAENRTWVMLAHWAEPDAVHLALLDLQDNSTAAVTLPCPALRYPSVGQWHPPAIRLERTIRDLYGIGAERMPDARPWLDHGRWQRAHPLSRHASIVSEPPPGYQFLGTEGEGLHQIAVGPVHAGIIEPGHFRFTANGETVVRLEERLGYVHKGIEGLWVGADLARGARLAARVS
jgi:Respiratory-chain NADH dehydrogenase, 30 Kd subunit